MEEYVNKRIKFIHSGISNHITGTVLEYIPFKSKGSFIIDVESVSECDLDPDGRIRVGKPCRFYNVSDYEIEVL